MSHRAVILKEEGARLVVESLPISKPESSDVLIRTHALATNPVDHKMQDTGLLVKGYPIVLGSDVAGVVEAVGSAVTGLSKGDRVVGLADVLLSGDSRNGAFQEFVIVKESGVAKLPAKHLF